MSRSSAAQIAALERRLLALQTAHTAYRSRTVTRSAPPLARQVQPTASGLAALLPLLAVLFVPMLILVYIRWVNRRPTDDV